MNKPNISVWVDKLRFLRDVCYASKWVHINSFMSPLFSEFLPLEVWAITTLKREFLKWRNSESCHTYSKHCIAYWLIKGLCRWWHGYFDIHFAIFWNINKKAKQIKKWAQTCSCIFSWMCPLTREQKPDRISSPSLPDVPEGRALYTTISVSSSYF